ncbi:MAG: ABC transporter substrate-binding protein [Clostridiales Family XIII bacterium]|nr:ABC transporter substrate-binding protein [Clostridiales Family XIII bacterium]
MIAIVLSIAALSGCTAYNNFVDAFFKGDEETIRIGVFEPLSGAYAKYGAPERTGIELAHALYPDVDGKAVQLVLADNESNLRQAREAAQKLIEADISVVLGSYDSTLSIAGGEVFQESGVPAIAITNTNPVVTDAFDVYCRVCPVESEQGFAAAAYAADNLRTKKAAVLKERDNDFAVTLTKNFSESFAEKSGAGDAGILTVEYDGGQTDFAEQLKAIEKFGAKVVFFPGAWDAGVRAMTEAGRTGFSMHFLGTDEWRTDGMLTGYKSGAMPSMAFTAYYSENADMTEMSSVFLKAYRGKFGADAVPDPAAALAFDAYLIALESIRAAGSPADRKAILTALRGTKAFPGASGEITFDENGNPIKPITIITVSDGKFISIDTVSPEKKKGK